MRASYALDVEPTYGTNAELVIGGVEAGGVTFGGVYGLNAPNGTVVETTAGAGGYVVTVGVDEYNAMGGVKPAKGRAAGV